MLLLEHFIKTVALFSYFHSNICCHSELRVVDRHVTFVRKDVLNS